MKNDRLLTVFGQIDEKYISEARPKVNYLKEREKEMKTNKIIDFMKKPMVAVATLVLCVCLSGTTVLAATDRLQGFFGDVFRWNGAVVGTVYEQATDEVELKIIEASKQLEVELVLLCPDKLPYSELERLGIESYKIVDMDNQEIVKGEATEMITIDEGKVSVLLSLNDVEDGSYRLIISQLSGDKKADQKLVLNGNWEYTFTK